jgi:hypothetical protein
VKLSKPIKILIGLGTAWFAIYPFLFLAVWLSMVLGLGFMPQGSEDEFPLFMIPFFAIFPTALSDLPSSIRSYDFLPGTCHQERKGVRDHSHRLGSRLLLSPLHRYADVLQMLLLVK